MNSIVSTIKINKNWLYASALSLVLVGVFLLIQTVWAGPETFFLNIVGWLVMPIISFLGNVLLILIEILIGIFSFTEFIDTPVVQLGWVIVRDIANMAIVVALIIIAFATVFRIQRYAASQLLIKLIIAAILVNFSLLIAGLLIDFGQVIMMTFVNQFQSLAAGNLTVGFGIEDMLKISTDFDLNIDFTDVLGAMFLAVVLLLAAIAVILVIIVVLLQRIIFLWLLAIFAPMAWVAPLLPGGSSWGSNWWSNFTKQVFIGPILAFGFWLSMSVLAGLSANQSLISLTIQNTDPAVVRGSSQIARFVSEASTPQAIFDFMVTIGLLLGTLWMAKNAGGAAGSFASNTFNKFSKAGTSLVRAPFRTADKLSGLRRARESYQAYRAQREGIRKEKVQRAGAGLAGLRDAKFVPALSKLTQKGRDAARARVRVDKDKRLDTDLQKADQAYAIYDNNVAGLKKLVAGEGVGKGNKHVRLQAALHLAKKGNGFGEDTEAGKMIDRVLQEFGPDKRSKNRIQFENDVKANSTKGATNSELYGYIAQKKSEMGANKLTADILSGVIDSRIYNNADIQKYVNETLADESKDFGEEIFKGSRNSDHLESINKTFDKTARDMAYKGTDLHKYNYEKTKDKRREFSSNLRTPSKPSSFKTRLRQNLI